MSMFTTRKARIADITAINHTCSAGYRATYPGLLSEAEIEAIIAEWYSIERITADVAHPHGWNGWWVVLDDDEVVGAGGGAFHSPASSELYVLNMDPYRLGEGAGTLLLSAITEELNKQGAREQWVAVTPGNMKGIPFYVARGFQSCGSRPAFGATFQEGRESLLYWRPLPAYRSLANPAIQHSVQRVTQAVHLALRRK